MRSRSPIARRRTSASTACSSAATSAGRRSCHWASITNHESRITNRKYATVTFGCRVNQADSLVIEQELRSRGATDAPIDEADLVIVNTCSVTATADQGARQTIRRIARHNPDVRVVVT